MGRMKVDEPIPCPAGFTSCAGILGEPMIPLRVDDDDRLTTEDRLSDEQVEQARFPDAGRANDQRVSNQMGEFRIQVTFGGKAMNPVSAFRMLRSFANGSDNTKRNQGMKLGRLDVCPGKPLPKPEGLLLG